MERTRTAPGKNEADTTGIRWVACPEDDGIAEVIGGMPSVDEMCEPAGTSSATDPLETGAAPRDVSVSVELSR